MWWLGSQIQKKFNHTSFIVMIVLLVAYEDIERIPKSHWHRLIILKPFEAILESCMSEFLKE